MSYIRKVLLPGERVVYETGLHWVVYGRAILAFLIAAGLAIASFHATGEAAPLVLGLAVLAALVGLVFFISAGMRRATTELAVTDQRVVFKRGLLARHTVEMNRAKVESVDVDQSLLGRLFGYGTVQLRGTGGSLEPVATISDPIGFRSHITVESVSHPVTAG